MDHDLSLLPPEVRRYEGTPAGVATRCAASVLDGLLVGVSLLAAYGGYVALRLVLSPRSFWAPDPSLLLVLGVFFLSLVVYLTLSWWLTGRSVGDHVMGIQVVTRLGGSLGILRAAARAALCAAFPIGLLWCAVDRERRSVQDLVVHTSVVHKWLH